MKYHIVSEEADFEVDFPEEPTRTETLIEESDSPGSSITYRATASGGLVFYSINCHRYDAQKEADYNLAYNTQVRLEEMVVGTMNKGDNELLSKEFISFLDIPAIKFVIRNALQLGEERIFLLLNFLIFFKDGNVYELSSMHLESMALEPSFEEFAASLTLL